MSSRCKKAKAKKITTAKVKGKNTTERSDDAGGDAGRDAGHVTQQEATVSVQSTEKVPGKDYFHRLPIEVRQMIYALAVIEEDTIYPVQVEARANRFHGGVSATKAFASLLLTCRGFYEELLSYPHFYRENTFGFYDCQILITFLAALSPARRAMIRKIEYTVGHWETYRPSYFIQSAATLLSHCTSFQWLKIIIPVPYWYRVRSSCPQALLAILTANPMESFSTRSDGNDWRRLRTASVLHFQISIATGSHMRPPHRFLISGLGVSSDHANLQFSGEHGCTGINANLVEVAHGLNTRILQLGVHCNPKYAIDKPITGSRFQEALIRSKLDVYGDDRIGQHDQSGIVSRGTRSRKLRARQVSSNGVLPRAAWNPKYIEVPEDEDDIEGA